MTIRNPKGKAARTMAAKKIEAIAADAQILIDGLKDIAQSYRTNEGDHSYDAGMVDLALGHLIDIGRSHVWPRLTHSRKMLLRSGGRGPVYASVPLAPPEHIIILCPPGHRRGVEEDIRKLGRNPRDKRIHFVIERGDHQRIQGMDRNTPWFCCHAAEVYRELLAECRARFSGSRVQQLADIINLIDWTQGRP